MIGSARTIPDMDAEPLQEVMAPIFTGPADVGVGVAVDVAVAVGVGPDVAVAVGVGVGVAVSVGVKSGCGVGERNTTECLKGLVRPRPRWPLVV